MKTTCFVGYRAVLAVSAAVVIHSALTWCSVFGQALPLTTIAGDKTLLDDRKSADGFKSIFNGKDLTGWEGLPQFWSVLDGAITGQTIKEMPKENTFLVWKDGDVGDFELRASYRLIPNNKTGFANSGIQYRSKIYDPDYFVVGGYQADMEAGPTYSGILYEERERGILASRGQKVIIHPSPNDPDKPEIEVVGSLGRSEDIQARIKTWDWNEYLVIARGNHLQHFINGMQTVDVIDEQPTRAAKTGILALQLHRGDPMTVQFKNIRLKVLDQRADAKTDIEKAQGDWVAAKVIDNGEAASADLIATLKLKITGEEFSLKHPEGEYRGRIKLHETASPKVMDITMDDGTELPAIYEVGSEGLKVCYGQSGAARPKAFESSPGSDQTLVVYKRKGS